MKRMFSNFSFWMLGTIVTQLLTAFFHALSFVAKEKPANETEKQLISLIREYKIDMGAGIKRSYGNLFVGVSACFTLIYLMGAVQNWYFLRSGIDTELWEGLLLIQLVIYGLIFLLQVFFTFLPPIIVTGIVFLFLAGAYFTL